MRNHQGVQIAISLYAAKSCAVTHLNAHYGASMFVVILIKGSTGPATAHVLTYSCENSIAVRWRTLCRWVLFSRRFSPDMAGGP